MMFYLCSSKTGNALCLMPMKLKGMNIEKMAEDAAKEVFWSPNKVLQYIGTVELVQK
jgi:hypothetical protein